MSPTSRTLKLLRDGGLTCQVVERFCQFSKRRVDLFGVIDLVALDSRQTGLLGVQATSGDHHAERVQKVLASPLAKLWVACGNRLQVISWSKRSSGSRRLWLPRIQDVMLGEFPEAE